MAKKSKIAKDRQRRIIVARHAERRAALKEVLRSPRSSAEEREAARRALSRLPRDASPTRLRNRDAVDGRARGYYRAFGLSRIRLREMAHRGELPGVTKSSW
ncbi:small subunit ribosomal protein S14 [Streptoalloteichus tenebrarius]|uniref:Small ribosomal subunit protein uS14 n=1 Tax=Streptoalloteichus tenebrarius (strain ATCC 17920 / DSM 40477 / JCM 4838 / CBS 697.72 / NBRC 16177 / NCIMB 11028 / NRRL B-12390 / A12253. 1 / ISP 5477) TaxID=1933 RepID=A0ABT1I2M6_STRSD|nr:30S ribosomal protein S14 [Streptoalloteichus tenebrarius]MCP2261971.1 small subunit ribosomal protein S14 [Streptoalloteichus tenebrarius]BFF01271.1 30S ribosomal protein S14 [Streptoalloteichus tenebrarius]